MHETTPKYGRILLGAPICDKIKQIYFPDDTWFSCYRKVANKFTELKKIARKYFPDELQMHRELGKFSEKDIQDCFEDS